jgi:MFS superfamily sulfate permease-like transporter
MAGLTVAIVALPLALAFGLIAFAPVQGPAAGLWSAILAGFIAAMLGGSSHALTGPTGVLAVLTAGLVATHGGFASPDASSSASWPWRSPASSRSSSASSASPS